jgi:GNAT superfamily N-acetyltransferase
MKMLQDAESNMEPPVNTVTVTYLQLLSPGELRAKRSADPRLRIAEATTPQWRFNRFLYFAVGDDWSWYEKRVWTDEQWRDYVESDRLRTFVAYHDGSPAGYYELRRDEEGGVEVVYLGLLPAFIGRGFGGALVTSAIEEAWRMEPARVWLHTCTLDHPSALANYQARGMQIYHVEARQRKATEHKARSEIGP